MCALICLSSAELVKAQAEIIDSVEFPLIPETALSEALMGIKLTPSDLSFRTDYAEIDSSRLPIVDSLTRDPLKMISFADDVSNLLFEKREDALKWLLGFESNSFISDEMRSISLRHAGDTTELHFPSLASESDCLAMCLNSTVVHQVNTIYRLIAGVRIEVDSFFNMLSLEEFAFVRDTVPELLLEDVEDEFKPVEVLDSLQKFEEELSKRFIPIAVKLTSQTERWNKLKRYAVQFQSLMFGSAFYIEDYIENICNCDQTEFQYEVQTPLGLIAVGGYGRNSYAGKYIYILDLGGNDRYDLEQINSPQYIYDISGNDQYTALTDFALGSGFLYPAFLIDSGGDDIYNGRNFSLGSGLFSVGMLVDESGNDKYYGDTHTQGAGTFGIGMLVDKSGSDNYHCALFGQAFAFVRGLGILCDINGNDIYFAGGKYKDVLRYKDHYLSLSQGFAYGLRPRMSGGVAILADSSGHDTYISDIFGQGSSYWYALGIQTDFAGNDKYLSFQYAQGAATHLTLGILMDKTGDDYYFSKGVSQGCGHDLAAGILVDYFGNDTYQAYDLSQGAGSANGFGWLVDYRGDDSYQIKGRHNTQGYGNPRRDYGSIGLFMDLMGSDEYIGNGSDNSFWIINSKWGIGMDVDFWKSDSAEAKEK